MGENSQSIDTSVIPVHVESIEEMRSRLPMALHDLCECKQTNGIVPQVEVYPENVFDNEDGIRAVIRKLSIDNKPPLIYAAIASSPNTIPKWESSEQFIVDACRFMHDLTDKLVHKQFQITQGAILITYDL